MTVAPDDAGENRPPPLRRVQPRHRQPDDDGVVARQHQVDEQNLRQNDEQGQNVHGAG